MNTVSSLNLFHLMRHILFAWPNSSKELWNCIKPPHISQEWKHYCVNNTSDLVSSSMHGSSSRLVNLVHRNIVREAIEDPDDKIDFSLDETLLQVHLVPFRGGRQGIDFWEGEATIVLIQHKFAKELGLHGRI